MREKKFGIWRKKSWKMLKDGKRCRPSYGMKQSILWGGGWDCEGEGVGLNWEEGEEILSPAHRTAFVLYQHYPKMPPADFPSALAPFLIAAGIRSPFPFFPRMSTMDWGAVILPGSKITSTSHFHDSALLPPFCPFDFLSLSPIIHYGVLRGRLRKPKTERGEKEEQEPSWKDKPLHSM